MSGELILIVEDNEKNLKLVRDLLQFNGYRTIEAKTAREAVSLAKTQSPALVLMDVQLPDSDGVTAMGWLRQEANTAAAPIVAVTAYAMKGDRDRLVEAGFDGYVSKPIDIKTFPGEVRKYLDRGEAP